MYSGTDCTLHKGTLAWASFIRGRGTCVFVQRCCPLPKPPVGLCPPRGRLFNNRSPQGEDFCSSRQATCSSYGHVNSSPKVTGLRQFIMRAPGSGQLGSVGGSCSGSHTAATMGQLDLVSSPSFLVLGWHGGTCGSWAGLSMGSSRGWQSQGGQTSYRSLPPDSTRPAAVERTHIQGEEL